MKVRLGFALAFGAVLAIGACAPATGSDESPPEKELSLRAGDDLQRALDRARPGDVITLEAGATFTGPFTLPAKPGDEWITLRSSDESRLPPAGVRVGPSHADPMPKLEAASDTVIATEPGAHHYRFVGIEIRPRAGTFVYSLVTLGSNETSSERLPHHILFERCYLHGDPKRGTRRGIALNSRETEILDSYFADFKEVGADSQAIAGWNGAGPFRIENNYLEGAGENVMFGGADPSIRNLVPADIVIRRNDFKKPLAWKEGEPTYQGTPWTVKNLLELKNARRVVVEGNLFDQNWEHAQNGFAILFTVRNQDGGAPWSVVEDVTFANNVVRHTGSGINILGRDNSFPSGQTRRIAIRNNLFEDVGGGRWGGDGRLFQILDGAANVTIEHNTAFHTGNIITAEGQPHIGFVFRDNIVLHNDFGIVSAALFPGGDFRRNVIVGGSRFTLPPGNFFPRSLDKVGFVDYESGQYRLAKSSPYRNAASDGKDVGVDFARLEAARGQPDKQPSPAPLGSQPDKFSRRADSPLVSTEPLFPVKVGH